MQSGQGSQDFSGKARTPCTTLRTGVSRHVGIFSATWFGRQARAIGSRRDYLGRGKLGLRRSISAVRSFLGLSSQSIRPTLARPAGGWSQGCPALADPEVPLHQSQLPAPCFCGANPRSRPASRRRTERLDQLLTRMGVFLGGEAGARLASCIAWKSVRVATCGSSVSMSGRDAKAIGTARSCATSRPVVRWRFSPRLAPMSLPLGCGASVGYHRKPRPFWDLCGRCKGWSTERYSGGGSVALVQVPGRRCRAGRVDPVLAACSRGREQPRSTLSCGGETNEACVSSPE